MRLFATVLEEVTSKTGGNNEMSNIEKFTKAFKKRTGDVYQNWIQGWAITERRKKKEYKTITDEVTFNKEGLVHKNHPFTEREFDGAFKECGCLPDCGCKDS